VTNLAARLCAMAGSDQILVSQRVRHGIVGPVDCREVGPLDLKGFSRPVEAHEVIALHQEGGPP
jgi:adenylate cyclase